MNEIIDLKKYIFVVHSPYQIRVSEDIAKHLDLRAPNTILIVEGERFSDSLNEKKWGSIIYTHESNGKKIAPIDRFTIYKLLKEIENKTSPTSKNILFLSDLSWPLNNQLAHALYKKGLCINLFEDGTGSYLKAKINLKAYSKQLFRQALGFIRLSYKFTPYTGGILGQDDNIIKNIYLYHPHLIETNNKVIKITKSIETITIQKKLTTKKILILDQPLDLIFKPENIRHAEAALLNILLKENPSTEIYIKRHPRDPQGRRGIKQSIAMHSLNPNITAESAATLIEATHIFSFVSTALINIKSQNNEIHCFAITPKNKSQFKSKDTSIEIEQLFLKTGIELLEYI